MDQSGSCVLLAVSILAAVGIALTGSCLPGEYHPPITWFAVDCQVGIASCKYPASQSFCGMLTSQAGVGSEALGVVAILPLSRGILPL